MDDIVTRLRSTCKADKDCPHDRCFGYCLPLEAADEIERLRAIITRQGIELIVAHSENAGMYDNLNNTELHHG